MAKYRERFPLLSNDIFLTDGGLETTLVFHDGIDLPCFAAFVLLADEEGRERLRNYFRRYVQIAQAGPVGLILESATWRANPDWGAKIGYSVETLAQANRRAIELCEEIRREGETETVRMPISGCLGPRGDGYKADTAMSIDEAAEYHRSQIEVFRDAGADLVSAMTMTYVNEATGIARAAQSAGMPSVISFTVETDGKLPDGTGLGEAITVVDRATGGAPAYYMINCAHPTHFRQVLDPGAPWMERIRGVRANASKCSHAELDEAETLDDGDPEELGREFRELREIFPNLNVLGGCCGTDHRHIEAIRRACVD